MRLFKTGAIFLILLGILHLTAQFFGKPEDPALDSLLQDMQDYKISLMGDHNMLKFHTGFSVMMGFLLSAWGVQSFMLRREILKNRTAFLGIILITAIAFIIALMFFHILAFGFIAIALGCFVVAFVRSRG